MANFMFDKQTVGKTSSLFEIELNGTVEIGDLVDDGVEKADESDSAIYYLAMDGGDDGDSILMTPLISGVTVLRGTVNSDGGITSGDLVGIDANQELDADASNDLFVALEDGSDGDVIRVLVIAGL